MKAFRFTLQALLTLRQREERFAMEHYAQAVLSRQQAHEQWADRHRELEAVRLQLQEQLQAGVVAAFAGQAQAFCHSLELRRESARALVVSAEQQVQSALQSMLETRRRREVVETCREKQRVRYARQCQYLEDRHHDEIASRRQPQVLAWRFQN
jgi:flagellar export protein FliJ